MNIEEDALSSEITSEVAIEAPEVPEAAPEVAIEAPKVLVEAVSEAPDLEPSPEAVRMVTLICPEGAFDYPVSHGEREYYPYRLTVDHSYPTREFGGPWVVDVPIEIYHHFLGPGGFKVYEG